MVPKLLTTVNKRKVDLKILEDLVSPPGPEEQGAKLTVRGSGRETNGSRALSHRWGTGPGSGPACDT